jgi:hypothetical protein
MSRLTQPRAAAHSADRAAESQFARVFEQVTNRLLESPGVDVESLLAEFPDHADQLRELLPTIAALAEFGQMSHSHHGADASHSLLSPAEGQAAGVLGDFRLIREVGRGGMGIVYEAEQISLGRRVALKVLPFASVLDDRQLARFKNEARAAATLHHTNIVPVFSVGCERGVHFYAMQYIDGHTLADVIAAMRRATGSVSADVISSAP